MTLLVTEGTQETKAGMEVPGTASMFGVEFREMVGVRGTTGGTGNVGFCPRPMFTWFFSAKRLAI